MSNVVSQGASPLVAERPRSGEDEFNYRPVPVLAPLTLFFGICSVAALITVVGLSVGFVGLLIGEICLWQIRKAQGELGGRTLARIGVVLSALFVVLGGSYHGYVYATEVPEGYERMSFSWLSKQELKFEDGVTKLTPEVEALDGKQVYVKGYMYPTGQLTGLSRFLLLKDTGQCCFGGEPKMTDMIVVEFKNGMTVDHHEMQLVGVAGIFHAKQVMQAGQLTAIYSLEGTHFQ